MVYMSTFALFAALLALGSCGLDTTFCVEKQQLGDAPGTLYYLEETCNRCACDGRGYKFCSRDYNCIKRKEALNKQPCVFAANKIPHGSQIQVDCNICSCKNTTMICTKDICTDESISQKKTPSVIEQPKKKTHKKCQDTNKHCTYWAKQGLCDKNTIVKKKCIKACGRCEGSAPKVVAPAPKKHCEDTDTRCKAWFQRGGAALCQKNYFVRNNCKMSCGGCSGSQKPVAKKTEKVECKNENDKCEDWSKRKGLCESSGYLKKKCMLACGICKIETEKPKVKEVERDNETNESTVDKCVDTNPDCSAWAGAKADHCNKNRYVQKNCRLSCKVCTPSHAVVSSEVVNKVAVKVKEEVSKQLSFEELWRQRLIAEGKLKVKTGPDGCTFRQGGRVFPYGSAIQGSCGLCKCKRKDGGYEFDCESC